MHAWLLQQAATHEMSVADYVRGLLRVEMHGTLLRTTGAQPNPWKWDGALHDAVLEALMPHIPETQTGSRG